MRYLHCKLFCLKKTFIKLLYSLVINLNRQKIIDKTSENISRIFSLVKLMLLSLCNLEICSLFPRYNLVFLLVSNIVLFFEFVITPTYTLARSNIIIILHFIGYRRKLITKLTLLFNSRLVSVITSIHGITYT